MGTDFSQTGLCPVQHKGPPTPALQTWLSPSRILAQEDCVALPGMLAAAPLLGSKMRTIWWSEGTQDSAGERQLSQWQPHAGRITRHEVGDMGERSPRGRKPQGSCL